VVLEGEACNWFRLTIEEFTRERKLAEFLKAPIAIIDKRRQKPMWQK